MTRKWEPRDGKVLVVEDSSHASPVIVARDLKDKGDKTAALVGDSGGSRKRRGRPAYR
jgi:hypothetical protein